ncbi:carbohydrate kinase family protein [Haloterrigena alkaliphila]|uniref:Carbohydrate kinase n=1 Tax=Haloterrigena alkaliphila TaxID=2816475 RepID=A0A8A2VE70_9EURY|nr:carbohydrate kinase [Haloterrigena alkaliphila]QSW98672.1 carbohydrate kinase [Haloterrigena alkaliphila]
MASSVLVAGETLIDFIPDRPGPLEDVAGFDRRPGGAPANVAVGLARLEEPPLFWTRVGADPFGRYLETVLEDAGIPDRFVERDPVAKTTLAFVTHDEAGDREFTFYREDTADTRLEQGRIDDETLADCEWVHVGGVTLASEPARTATLDLLERAAEADCTTSFDPNFRPELWSDDGAFEHVGREALAHVDVCKATVAELRRLGFGVEAAADTESTPAAVARAVLETGTDAGGPHTVFVTRGSDGAVAATSARGPWTAGDSRDEGPRVASQPGFDVDVVDTTGAGDAFVAGLIAGMRDGRSLQATLGFANAVAASATTGAGAMATLPTRDMVESILEDAS